MITHPELVSSATQIESLAEKLRQHDIIAFDTEFIRESTFFPVVELIQIATEEESWLVDVQAFANRKQPAAKGAGPGKEALKPLLEIFENKKILKVVHAAQGDQECLFTAFGVLATPCFDTAVAASLCGYGEGVGLANLIKSVLGVSIKKGHARTNWSIRPLPQQLFEYAHADVEHLVLMGKKLLEHLEQLGRRQWAFELSAKFEEPALYEPSAEEMALKLARGGRFDSRSLAALIELIRWREERVRQANIPRRWVADDAVLMDLAHVRPKDLGHLSAFRGINKGELKHSGEAILQAIKRGAEIDEKELPKISRSDSPTPSESRVLDLLRCYVAILADEHEIAAKHLLSTQQALHLLKSRLDKIEDLVTEEFLTEGAARLVGADLLAFLKGQRGLTVDPGRPQVRVVDLRQG